MVQVWVRKQELLSNAQALFVECGMAMGTRKQREKQEDIWIAHRELAVAPGHPFYQRLNELLAAEGFDELVESRCAKLYAEKYGRALGRRRGKTWRGWTCTGSRP